VDVQLSAVTSSLAIVVDVQLSPVVASAFAMVVDVQLSAVVQPSPAQLAVPATYAHVTVATNEDVQLSAVVQPSTGVFAFGVPAT
jgi:hypothetical protein